MQKETDRCMCLFCPAKTVMPYVSGPMQNSLAPLCKRIRWTELSPPLLLSIFLSENEPACLSEYFRSVCFTAFVCITCLTKSGPFYHHWVRSTSPTTTRGDGRKSGPNKMKWRSGEVNTQRSTDRKTPGRLSPYSLLHYRSDRSLSVLQKRKRAYCFDRLDHGPCMHACVHESVCMEFQVVDPTDEAQWSQVARAQDEQTEAHTDCMLFGVIIGMSGSFAVRQTQQNRATPSTPP